MPINDFLPFATGGGANVMPQADYVSLARRTGGFLAGTALSIQCNKVWRQSSVVAASVAEFMASATGSDVLDNGDVQGFQELLQTAIRGQALNYAINGGSANELSITLDPVPAALSELTGTPLRIRIASRNSGAMTLNVNGLGARSIVHLDGSATAAGDAVAGMIATVIYNGSAFFLAGIGYSEVVRRSTATIYVRTDGNDNNDGSANNSSSALATIAAAITIAKMFSTGTIKLGIPGTYAGGTGTTIPIGWVLEGDIANQDAYVIDGSLTTAGAGAVILDNGLIRGVRILVSSSLVSCLGGRGFAEYTTLATSGSGYAYVLVAPGGFVTLGANCRSTGNSQHGFFVNGGGILLQQNFDVGPTAVTWSTAFLVAINLGFFIRGTLNPVFTSTAPSIIGTKYSISTNSIASTNGGGAGYFPGNVAGSVSSGGTYA